GRFYESTGIVVAGGFRFRLIGALVSGEDTKAARSASGSMKRGCKRSGEALSVASGPVFVMEKTHTLPRSLGRWNLDPSRAEAISPKNACGDDADSSIETGLCSKKYVIQ